MIFHRQKSRKSLHYECANLHANVFIGTMPMKLFIQLLFGPNRCVPCVDFEEKTITMEHIKFSKQNDFIQRYFFWVASFAAVTIFGMNVGPIGRTLDECVTNLLTIYFVSRLIELKYTQKHLSDAKDIVFGPTEIRFVRCKPTLPLLHVFDWCFSFIFFPLKFFVEIIYFVF